MSSYALGIYIVVMSESSGTFWL